MGGGAATHLPRLRRGFALFGQETRYVTLLYLQRILIFAALTFAIILTLDGATSIGTVFSERAASSGVEGPARMLLYLALRAGYDLPPILPIASILGVVWTELELAVSNERIMIANSGRRLALSLVPALLVGLLVGFVQFSALGYIRPLAVEIQTASNFRSQGAKFRQPVLTEGKWIVLKDALINARVEISDGVALRDGVFYLLGTNGALSSIVTAKHAEPSDIPFVWNFHNGSMWGVPQLGRSDTANSALAATTFDDRAVSLNLNPLWVENFDIQPLFLPQDILAALSAADRGIPAFSTYRSAYQERFAAVVNSLLMAAVTAALCIRWFAPRMHPKQIVKIIGFGALAYFLSQIFSMLGSYGATPAFVAAWSGPLALSVGLIVLIMPSNWWKSGRLLRTS